MMFREDGGRPNDRRGFVHKSFIGRAIGGVAKKFISSTPIGFAATTAFNIAKPKARATVPRSLTARPTALGSEGKERARILKFGGNGETTTALTFGGGGGGGSPCRANETALCCQLRNGDVNDQRQWQKECGVAGGGGQPGTPVGDAVMGRYGAALQPGVVMIERSVCLPGMNLGDDGLCYNKGAITNKQRMWPRGRQPLLTGGELGAIGIASRAGAKMDRAAKRLRALGMMKPLPARRKAPAHQHAKPVAAVSV